ncbi:MAG: thymidine kinase [Bacteroidota bacterium]|nr:thymidine kinase [Bacteroidota bacterium]
MFIEKNQHHSESKGTIEVVCGSMFSGKTEELIRRINRARIANQKVEIFKPELDKRYDKQDVVSHNKNAITSTPIENASQILLMTNNAEVIGIDEAQFFGDDLPDVCTQLANSGVRVIVAGLDMDFQGNPFGSMPEILAIADFVTKVHAICINCGALAQFSFRKIKNDNKVLLGEMENYQPLCRRCYLENVKKQNSHE